MRSLREVWYCRRVAAALTEATQSPRAARSTSRGWWQTAATRATSSRRTKVGGAEESADILSSPGQKGAPGDRSVTTGRADCRVSGGNVQGEGGSLLRGQPFPLAPGLRGDERPAPQAALVLLRDQLRQLGGAVA